MRRVELVEMKVFLLLITVIFLSSCGKLDFDGFKDKVISVIGNDAVNCGLVDIGENEEETNNCVVESFSENKAFYAFYNIQGKDSEIAHAIFSEDNTLVNIWQFDSDPSGGGASDEGVINKDECLNPTLSGSIENHMSLFICN